MSPPAKSFSEFVKQFRARWLQLSAGAAWLAVIVATVLRPPPSGPPDTDPMVRLPQFFTVIAFGLLLIGARQWNRKKDTLMWTAAAVVASVLGLMGLLRYVQLRNAHTASFDGTLYVLGELRSDPTAALQREACISGFPDQSLPDDVKLLDCAHGNASEFWTRESISANQRVIVVVYLAIALALVTSSVSVVQALRCAFPED
jgi:hypothetical protein